MKSLLRSPFVINCLGALIWVWMVVIGRTIRWRISGDTDAITAWSGDKGLVVGAWHEQIMLLPSGWTRQMRHWPKRPGRVAMLVSLSRDAAPVARALDFLGIETVRGSKANAKKRDKDKGGMRAVAEAIKLLRDQGVLCITPDGPRGPAKQVGAGPILLAQRAGATILPYALAVTSMRHANSWDRMIIPYPFGRGAIVFGTPIETTGLTHDSLERALQTGLDAANDEAQKLIGRDPSVATPQNS